MALYFGNLYPNTVWISFVYPDATCTPTPFRKMGWWQVDSLQLFNAWNIDLKTINPTGNFILNAAFFAEEFRDEEGATWSGTGNNWYQISDVQFNQCYDVNTNCTRQPDFVPLNLAGEDFVIWLGPAAGQLFMDGYPPSTGISIGCIYQPQDVPLVGEPTLEINIFGNYSFHGSIHNSKNVVSLFKMVSVFAFADADKTVYTFQHVGVVTETQDDVWSVSGHHLAISENWYHLYNPFTTVACGTAHDGNLAALTNSLVAALGGSGKIISIAVA
jgi:hypothetical protein